MRQLIFLICLVSFIFVKGYSQAVPNQGVLPYDSLRIATPAAKNFNSFQSGSIEQAIPTLYDLPRIGTDEKSKQPAKITPVDTIPRKD